MSNYITVINLGFTQTLIFGSILGLALVFSFIYFRKIRNRNINLNKKRLEEFLYYEQLSEMPTTTVNNLPEGFRKLQLNRKKFIAELRKGLIQNEFVLYYQPIINVKSGKIAEVEALIRWQHPVYGLLGPEVFLPLCENSGFIIPLGKWIFQTACNQIKIWQAMGFSRLSVSINLSTRQLNDDQLSSSIKEILLKNKISPHCLKLEITENSLMKDLNSSIIILNELREIGLQLSLDDFGTGYASFHYLKHFPINNLKIDKIFINDIAENITSFRIVESLINLSKRLGLTITAEGVENDNQLNILKEMNCDLVQGFLYSKPIPVHEFNLMTAGITLH